MASRYHETLIEGVPLRELYLARQISAHHKTTHSTFGMPPLTAWEHVLREEMKMCGQDVAAMKRRWPRENQRRWTYVFDRA